MSFSWEENALLLNMTLYDREDRVILHISDNELMHTTEFWNITFIGNKLKMNNASRNIFCEIEFKAPDTVKINKANLYSNGRRLIIQPDYIRIGPTKLTGCTAIDNYAGIVL